MGKFSKSFATENILAYLKSSLLKFYGRHHDMVDRYEIYVSQMTYHQVLQVDYHDGCN
jgi:hypothetical protein